MAKKNSDIIGQVDRLASNVRKGRTSYYDSAPTMRAKKQTSGQVKDGRGNEYPAEYTHYVVIETTDFAAPEDVDSGWEFASDAKDRVKELKEDGERAKVVGKAAMLSRGLLFND